LLRPHSEILQQQNSAFGEVLSKALAKAKNSEDAQEDQEEEMAYLIEAIVDSLEMTRPLECDIAILWD
jgi:hypothetical protein